MQQQQQQQSYCNACSDTRVCDPCLAQLRTLQAARAWYRDGEVGMSSSSLCTALLLDSAFLLGCTPYDQDDFMRCVALLQHVPQLRAHLAHMKQLDSVTSAPGVVRRAAGWAWWIDNWDALEQASAEQRDAMIAQWRDTSDFVF